MALRLSSFVFASLGACAIAQTACPTPSFKGAFTAGNLVTLRVGDATSPLTSVATAAFLDEYDLSGGYIQSVELPSALCNVNGGSVQEGGMTLSADMTTLAVPCYAVPRGEPVKFDSLRNAFSLRYDGTDASTTFLYPSASFKSIATLDGSAFYSATTSGIAYTPDDSNGNRSEAVAGSRQGFRGLTFFRGSLYGLDANTAVIYGVGGLAAPPPTASPAPAPVALPGMVSSSVVGHSLVFENAASIWVTYYSGSYTLSHYVLNDASGSWEVASGYPITSARVVVGLSNRTLLFGRGVVGFVDPVTREYALAYATNGFLVRFNTVSKQFSVIAQLCIGTMISGVALAPVLPSQSPSPSAAPTVSATPSVSATIASASTTPIPAGIPAGSPAWVWVLTATGIAVLGGLAAFFLIRLCKQRAATLADRRLLSEEEPLKRTMLLAAAANNQQQTKASSQQQYYSRAQQADKDLHEEDAGEQQQRQYYSTQQADLDLYEEDTRAPMQQQQQQQHHSSAQQAHFDMY